MPGHSIQHFFKQKRDTPIVDASFVRQCQEYITCVLLAWSDNQFHCGTYHESTKGTLSELQIDKARSRLDRAVSDRLRQNELQATSQPYTARILCHLGGLLNLYVPPSGDGHLVTTTRRVTSRRGKHNKLSRWFKCTTNPHCPQRGRLTTVCGFVGRNGPLDENGQSEGKKRQERKH